MRRCSALVLFFASLGFGQVSFEVASVKVHEGPSRARPGVFTSGTRLEANARTVVALLMFAYNVRLDQVAPVRALEPFGDVFYDLDARAPGKTTPTMEDFRRMMQTLLSERFRLRFHREMREAPVYELVVSKNGPKFNPAAPGASAQPRNSASGRDWSVSVAGVSMQGLAELIEDEGFTGRHVIDKTGLTGNYAIHLTFTPDIPPNRGADDPADISIFAALAEQLGLRLQPAKANIGVIVVDHVENPTEN